MPPEAHDAAQIHDMIRAGEGLLRHVAGRSRGDLDTNEMLRDAMERKIEIIGEAARSISDKFIEAHPEIPWRKIMATRHILAHDYDEVNYDIVWQIAIEHVPQMLGQLRTLLPPPPPDPEPENRI